MDPEVLSRTVTEYNRFCREKKDGQFGKDPQFLVPRDVGPFYAVYAQRFSEAAMGGLMVNADCRVLRNDGTAIPGLYGVGDATSAMHINGRLAVVSELTWAVASTYTAATEGVAYIDAKGGAN